MAKKATTRKAPAKSATKKKAAGVVTLMGKPVPRFSLPGNSGRSLNLAQKSHGKIVLYFYPRDNTPGCTLEGQDFARLYQQFQAAGVEVYGISRDSLKSHESFCTKMGFPFTLLSDSDEKVCNLFGVMKDKNMYGKKVRGIERSTFVVDADGVIRGEWRKVNVDGHAQEVLDFVKSI